MIVWITSSSLLVTVHVHLDRVPDPGAARRSFGTDVSQPGEQEREALEHKVARASFHFMLLLPFSYIFLLIVPGLACLPFVYSVPHPVIKSSNAAALANTARVVIFIQR